MSHSAQFTATVRAIQNKVPTMDVYTLIAVADEVCRVHGMPVTDLEGGKPEHERLVALALHSEEIPQLLGNDRKILAIKELRYLGSCGLREAKDAIEDPRVARFLVRQ